MKSDRPAHFYKYRPIDQYLEPLLTSGSCYFPAPKELNDPFEVAPLLHYDPKGKNSRKHVYRRAAQLSPELSPAKRLQFAENVLRAHSTPKPAGQSNEVGLYCLTTQVNSPLMWAHYANSHKGICIEFDSTKWLFSCANKVTYQENIPVLDTANQSNKEFLDKICLTKAKCWEYEDEWRIISISGMSSTNRIASQYYAQMLGPGVHTLPIDCITGLVFGLRVEKATQNEIITLCESLGLNLTFSRIEIERHKFELVERRI